MRLPNGFGGISKLPGNRRNPYRARVTILCNLNDDGVLQQKYKTIGYFATREDALIALSNYHKNPYEIDSKITFAEVYDKWASKKFDEISRSNINGYKASYKLCSDIYNTKFADLKLIHLQGVVDSADRNYPTLKKLKVLFNQLFDYAVQNEIIGKDKHIVEYINIGKAQKSDKHYRFTQSEIDILWRWADKNEYVQVILMLIYSGVRPGELFNVKKSAVDLDEKSFYIEKGKNDNAVRKVPIHDKTYPFFQYWMQKNDSEYLTTQLNGSNFRFDTNHGQYTESYWKPLLLDMGILKYKNNNGEEKEHSPDDTRHTFTTM